MYVLVKCRPDRLEKLKRNINETQGNPIRLII